MDKILSIIDSATNYKQLEIAYDLLHNSPIVSESDVCMYTGAIALKKHQLYKQGLAKITGVNRFPVDDEQPEQLKKIIND